MTNPLPLWNARKIREASVPPKGKALRNVVNYVQSKRDDKSLPFTGLTYAFLKATYNI